MNVQYQLIIGVTTVSILYACASQLPKGGNYVDSFTNQPTCNSTKLVYEFVSEPDEHWQKLLSTSTEQANIVLVSDTFAQQCQKLKMNRTNGKSIQEVCEEMACSGTKILKYGFFDKGNTSAIARELGNGVVEFNVAKPNSGAGSPGNIAHEFTHTLGYSHFTNFSWLGKYSVPYEAGGLVDELSK